jgi:hypothetical protein
MIIYYRVILIGAITILQELPLQFIYFEQCHYNWCDVRIVPYYTYPTMLDPQIGYCNFVWAKMPPSHRIVGSACHLLLSLSSPTGPTPPPLAPPPTQPTLEPVRALHPTTSEAAYVFLPKAEEQGCTVTPFQIYGREDLARRGAAPRTVAAKGGGRCCHGLRGRCTPSARVVPRGRGHQRAVGGCPARSRRGEARDLVVTFLRRRWRRRRVPHTHNRAARPFQ